MKTITQHIRDNIHARMGISEQKRIDELKMRGEIQGMIKALEDIVELARPRLIMGGIRHGSKWDHAGLMSYIRKKLDQYVLTGNLEMLVDVVNLCVVESQLKTHPKHHFEAEDRK